ncbi:MAG: DUF3048 domain-containing protein [Actinomycetota bacterium]
MQRRLLNLLLVLVMLAGACTQKEDPPEPTPRPSATVAELPSHEPSPEARPTCPLTGQESPEGLEVNRPALAIKIDNHPRARPQAGLESADIVYEELVEGGLTRFLAIYHCGDAARLGPTRSARLVDPDLLVQYQPVLFGYSGAAPPVLAKVRSTAGVVDLVHGANGAAYSRQSGRPAPHNLFTSSERLRATSSAQGIVGAPKTGLVFDAAVAQPAPGSATPAPGSATPAPGSSPIDVVVPPAPVVPPGRTVSFAYSGGNSVSYSFDDITQRYLRSMNGSPHRDENQNQLSMVNVVVLKVNIQLAAGTPHITVTGEGEATVLHNGRVVTGRWRRSGLADQITLVDTSGLPIPLAPGNTWINLVPSTQAVTVQ